VARSVMTIIVFVDAVHVPQNFHFFRNLMMIQITALRPHSSTMRRWPCATSLFCPSRSRTPATRGATARGLLRPLYATHLTRSFAQDSQIFLRQLRLRSLPAPCRSYPPRGLLAPLFRQHAGTHITLQPSLTIQRKHSHSCRGLQTSPVLHKARPSRGLPPPLFRQDTHLHASLQPSSETKMIRCHSHQGPQTLSYRQWCGTTSPAQSGSRPQEGYSHGPYR
jgi:hypothetical protein